MCVCINLPFLFFSAANENGSPIKQDLGQKKTQTSVRVLRGHSGTVTALHCVTRREVWDLVGDREDAGFFISGSTDCTVSCHILIYSFSIISYLLMLEDEFIPSLTLY